MIQEEHSPIILTFIKLPFVNKIFVLSIFEACIGVLGIQGICHFTFRDIEYYPFYFQGYGILCSIFSLLSGILNI